MIQSNISGEVTGTPSTSTSKLEQISMAKQGVTIFGMLVTVSAEGTTFLAGTPLTEDKYFSGQARDYNFNQNSKSMNKLNQISMEK